MAAPWDIPPFPKQGNLNNNSLFAAIGRTLNAWEEIEISMSHLFAIITAKDRFDMKANQEYGRDSNFAQRSAKLEKAACKHFIKHPSQPLEGEFCRLMRLVVGYSARRNDIAHAHVLPIHFIFIPDTADKMLDLIEKPQWCLVPPYFRANKFTNNNMPSYAFSSREINAFGLVFVDLAKAFSNLSAFIYLARFPSSRGIRLRPSDVPYKIRDLHIRKG